MTEDPYIAARQLQRRLETLYKRAMNASDKARADAAIAVAEHDPRTLIMVLATSAGRHLAAALHIREPGAAAAAAAEEEPKGTGE